MTLRIQPVHTIVHGIKYDSKFEAAIAKLLQPYVYKGCSIYPQINIEIKPESNNFKSRNWKCDFLFNLEFSDGYVNRYIEAKGFADPEFLPKMELLDYFAPETYKKLLIVIPNNFKAPKQWKTLEDKIVTVKELQLILDNLILMPSVPP